MVGTERYLLQNKDFRVFVSPDSKDTFNVFFKKILKTDIKNVCKLKLVREDQSFVFVHVEGIVSTDRECSLTLMDITQREIAEEKLQSSEIRYRRLFESAKGGIAILDFNTGRILDVNPFLIDLFGYSYEEFKGKELWEIGLFRDAEESKDSLRELHIKEYIQYEDLPLITKTGSHISVEVISNVYKIKDTKVIQCNIRDITIRKMAEQKLKETAIQLHELNATKDKFFSIIAHDLKGPFSAIIGYAELLVDQIKQKKYDRVAEHAEIIRSSSWRAMDLLKNLLEWARSQIGIMVFKPRIIEISGIIDDTKDLLKDSAIRKSIEVKVRIPEKFKVYADISMLKTVLRNLLSNAIKFTKPGGSILIEASSADSASVIAITDNGIGIKKDKISKLFRIEESGSTTGTQGEQGTGLGLLLCNDFVKKHGGKIWVESEEDRGSRFVFTLPGKSI